VLGILVPRILHHFLFSMPSDSKAANTAKGCRGALSILIGAALSLASTSSWAHVSEQGFVLLLPTGVYTAAGIAVVVATLIALAVLPHQATETLFKAKRWSSRLTGTRFSRVTSLTALLVLIALVCLGWFGPRDPLKNLAPLGIWTLWWIGLVSAQGILGDLWHWLNPWHGIAHWLGSKNRNAPSPTTANNPRASVWPALLLLIGFYLLMLADIAPDDPARLAVVIGTYAVIAMVGITVLGASRWFTEFDFTAIVMRLYGYLAPLARSPKNTQQSGFGLPGWALLEHPVPSLSLALFALVMLGCGSFDGINETFWWLGVIGVNPLDFQGRSTIVTETVIGMLGANVILIVVFAACTALGLKLARGKAPQSQVTFKDFFCSLSLCVLPIALAYHVSHFIASFLVNVQYSVLAITDPLDQGADWLGLGQVYVTTGFLNNHHTVELLWLTQAAIVVAGHLLSILLSHGVAVRWFQTRQAAVWSQIPLAAFMVAYTFLGLWLLASPRGA